MTSFFRTVDIMASYPNTLGLTVAPILIQNYTMLAIAPVIKTITRDVKKYMKLKSEVMGQRILPLAYDAKASGGLDLIIFDYLMSGDESESIDFWTVSLLKEK